MDGQTFRTHPAAVLGRVEMPQRVDVDVDVDVWVLLPWSVDTFCSSGGVTIVAATKTLKGGHDVVLDRRTW